MQHLRHSWAGCASTNGFEKPILARGNEEFGERHRLEMPVVMRPPASENAWSANAKSSSEPAVITCWFGSSSAKPAQLARISGAA